MRTRSAGELLFRLRQESANLGLLVAPPRLSSTPSTKLSLPDPEVTVNALRGSAYARQLEALADQIVAGRLPILGFTIDFDGNWRRDPVNHVESAAIYFRRIQYLDPAVAGDHKIIWELNRHQHWVALAQAFRLTGREEFLKTIQMQFDSWVSQNPFERGINWASALEVAFRAMSWIWVFHLAGDRMDPAWKASFLEQLYRHGRYLEHNFSVYFSPNTHLFGEAVVLHALGVLFPDFPRAAQWRRQGGDTVERELMKQVREDGSHFEQSTYYHGYTLDMALTWFLLEGRPQRFRPKIERMAEYLHALMGLTRRLPFLGDDDGGRWFHAYGPRDQFGRATLATCSVLFDRPDWPRLSEDLAEQAAWWLGPCAALPLQVVESQSRWFPDSGIAIRRHGDVHAIVKAGPFGSGSAGHSHADTLSIVLRNGEEEILVDPGTFTYVGDPEWRAWFRETSAHNTISIDRASQATPAGPFRWIDPPSVEVLHRDDDFLDATCRYRGFKHRRRFRMLRSAGVLLVVDDISGPPGEHVVEQFWHLGSEPVALSDRSWRIGARTVLAIGTGGKVENETGWRSPAYGVKQEAPVLRVTQKFGLPVRLIAAIEFSGNAQQASSILGQDLDQLLRSPSN